MKKMILWLAVIVAIALPVSLEAGGRHGHAGAAGFSRSGGAGARGGYAGRGAYGGYRFSGARMIGSPSRYYSSRGGTYGRYAVRPGNVSSLNQRGFAGSSTFARRGNLARGNFNNGAGFNHHNGNGVFARHPASWHSNWSHHHDHWWHGHRCHWDGSSWVLFDVGFYPWGWGYPSYYPYAYYPYGYFDPYYYGDPYYHARYEYGTRVYESAPADSHYDDRYHDSSKDTGDSSVSAVQERLAERGYYHGQIDGTLGPETQRAIGRFQKDRGMEPSGYLTPETLRSLGLQQSDRSVMNDE